MDVPQYPINDFGPLMTGLVIGGLGILHVFLAQFAIGGGLLVCYFEWLRRRTGSVLLRRFVDDYFRVIVLVSFVLGALTGVAMWFTTIQVSPRTIGLMVAEFHWVWAIEWTFFCLEVVAGYAFYRYGRRLNDDARLSLAVLYSTAAWMSLFWINGILSWQLTPGEWTSGDVWTGFFNAGFWPSLIFRTITSMATATLVACVVVNATTTLEREEKRELIHTAARFLAPMVLMPLLGVWYFASMPEQSRAWVMGGSVAMTMFNTLGIGASLLIGGYAVAMFLRKSLYVNGATALLLCLLAFLATAGGEFVREGVRKPYTVRRVLYSNSIRPDELAYLREHGCLTDNPYPLNDGREYPIEDVRKGARVFRQLCSICHTVDGANGIVHLTESWSLDQKRLMFAQLERTKTFMPPFAGTPEELEWLVQYVTWEAERDDFEFDPKQRDEALERIRGWMTPLDELDDASVATTGAP